MLARVICPHCWHEFAPHDTLWVASHPSLRGDPRLGETEALRFLPSRFTPNGEAIDELGRECNQLACPSCHLLTPRLLFEHPSLFVSIVGAPGSGKSYFLASAVHTLRRRLRDWFELSFTDAQADMNDTVVAYEEQLFQNIANNKPIATNQLVEKTQAKALTHHTPVLVGGQRVFRPRPMLFSLRRQKLDVTPTPGVADDPSRVLCLYDNAGESFLSGQDSALSPVTEHLAKSKLLMFLFDPTLHPKFNDFLIKKGVNIASELPSDPAARRQHLVFTEMANRTRRHANLPDAAKVDKPLIVVVTKKDLWGQLLLQEAAGGNVVTEMKTKTNTKGPQFVLRIDKIEEHSRRLRDVLMVYTPEIVQAAEAFANSVLFVGVSSLGKSPVQDPTTRQWVITPKDIQPDWVEIPILYGLSKAVPNLIAAGRSQGTRTGKGG